MDNKIFFSIVIPTFNRADFIERAIRSVLRQDYPDFEILVIDDGSTDNTEEIVRSIVDLRIRYYKKANNEERGAARNYGARLAGGDYVNFFDSDDICYPSHLTEALRLIKESGQPEIACLAYDIIDDKGRILRKISYSGDMNRRILSGNHISCDPVFLRKDIALQHPFSEDRKLSGSEDWVLWLRLASRYRLHYSNARTTALTSHKGRSVLNASIGSLVDREALIFKCLRDDPVFTEKLGRYFGFMESHMAIYVALHFAMLGHKYLSVQHLIKAIRSYPAIIFTKEFLGVIKNIIL